MDGEFHNHIEEFHNDILEFNDEKAAIKRKQTTIPKSMLGGLSLVGATTAAVILIVVAILTQILTSPLSIGVRSAQLRINIQNPDDACAYHYELTQTSDPDIIIQTGPLSGSEILLHLQELTPNTEYTLSYYAVNDQGTEFIDSFQFRTLPEGSAPPPTTTPIIQSSTPAAAVSTATAIDPVISEDLFHSYQLTVMHGFRDVPDANFTVTVTQDGQSLTQFTTDYDPANRTATVSFVCDPAAPGAAVDTAVTLTCSDGGFAESTLTLQTPCVNDVALDVTVSLDGTAQYTISGTLTAPSHGSTSLQITLTPAEDVAPVTFTLPGSGSFSQTATHKFNAPGTTQTASATIDLLWSMDEGAPAAYPSVSAEKEFALPEKASVTFSNIAQADNGYGYTATFAFPGMTGTTPQKLELIRQSMDSYDDSVIDTATVKVLTAADGLSVGGDGVVKTTYTATGQNVQMPQRNYHNWRAVLTYIDASGNTKTAEVTQHIAPLQTSYNDVQAVFHRDGNYAIVDFTMYTAINESMYPGSVALSELQSYGWDVEIQSSKLVGNIFQIKGRLTGSSSDAPSLSAYLLWTADNSKSTVYSGCGAHDFYESSAYITGMSHQFDPDGTPIGYESADMEHRFYNTAYQQSDYQTVYIQVTLANGKKVKIQEGQTSALDGAIQVIWNEADETIVNVTQTDIEVGDKTIVEYVVEFERTEPEMEGIVGRSTSQSIHLVEYIQV